MARVCGACLAVVPTTQGGRCPTCHQAHEIKQRAKEATRRPPTAQRYPAEYWANRRTLLDRGDPCHWCGGEARTADHLTPIMHGGGHGLDNLCASCLSCNVIRGNRMRHPTSLHQNN